MKPLTPLLSALSLFAAAGLLHGCSESTTPGDAGPDAGPTCTELIYAPGDGDLTRWPEPALVVEDATTATGYRLRFLAEDYPAITDVGRGFNTLFTEDLSDLDGFGVNSEGFFLFSRPFDVDAVPSGDATAEPAAGLGFLTLAPGDAALIPVTVRFAEDGANPILSPMRPLPATGMAAVYMTRALTAAAGGCLEPSAAMAEELASPTVDQQSAIDALVALGAIDGPADLVALTVFPTQSTVDQSVAIAADIAARDYTLDGPLTCVPGPISIQCDGTFTAFDYRDEDGVIRVDPAAVEPVSSYQVPLRIWLPLEGDAPHRTILFGHGLGSGREQGEQLARFNAPAGLATIAIPALQHGEHPTNPNPEEDVLPTVLRFFAFGDLSTKAVDGLVLRDHFRQSTYDKLQLTRILEAGLDADGDGAVDLDPLRLAYLGASLGGIMGTELLALTDTYGAAVLAVPGSNVITIVSASDMFSSLIGVLAPPGVTQGDIQRIFPVIQTILDRGDGGSYAPHVLRNRLVGDGTSPPPSVLLGVALDDNTVPNFSSWALARALDIPIVPELLRPVPGLSAAPRAPVSGNIGDGAATAGLLQFDVVDQGRGPEDASHTSTPASPVAVRAWLDFYNGHFDGGLAVIVDPYEAEGLAHE